MPFYILHTVLYGKKVQSSMVSRSQPKKQQASQYILLSTQCASIQGFQIVCFTAQQFSQRLHHHTLVITSVSCARLGPMVQAVGLCYEESAGFYECQWEDRRTHRALRMMNVPRLAHIILGYYISSESADMNHSSVCRHSSAAWIHTREDTQRRRLPIIKPRMKRENGRAEEERRK